MRTPRPRGEDVPGWRWSGAGSASRGSGRDEGEEERRTGCGVKWCGYGVSLVDGTSPMVDMLTTIACEEGVGMDGGCGRASSSERGRHLCSRYCLMAEGRD